MNMKAVMSIITISAAVALLNAPVLRAQETTPEPEGNAQAKEAVRAGEEAVKAKVYEQLAQVQAQQAQADDQANLAKAQDEFARDQESMNQVVVTGVGGGFGSGTMSAAPAYTQRLQNIVKRVPDHRPGGTLVIHSSDTDLKDQADLEKDLAVMSYILEKAASEKAGARGEMAWGGKAMGINLLFAPDASPLHSLYLEGYGALFLLNVGFPVLPSPQAEEQGEKTETTSAWEEAKQELYGLRGAGRVTAGPSEPYDKERVNRLRDGLLESLKNATNIRDLRPDDSITVCVIGAPNSGQPKAGPYVERSPGPPHERILVGWTAGPPRQTVMTIRVKKSDADAFAKGTITLEAFRKHAHIVTYAAGPETGLLGGGGESGALMGGFGGGIGGGGGGFGGGGVKF